MMYESWNVNTKAGYRPKLIVPVYTVNMYSDEGTASLQTLHGILSLIILVLNM